MDMRPIISYYKTGSVVRPEAELVDCGGEGGIVR